MLLRSWLQIVKDWVAIGDHHEISTWACWHIHHSLVCLDQRMRTRLVINRMEESTVALLLNHGGLRTHHSVKVGWLEAILLLTWGHHVVAILQIWVRQLLRYHSILRPFGRPRTRSVRATLIRLVYRLRVSSIYELLRWIWVVSQQILAVVAGLGHVQNWWKVLILLRLSKFDSLHFFCQISDFAILFLKFLL